MHSTKHGPFDGDTWENLMQMCFRIKYESEHYQQLPASPGDYGIEGFTKTGKAFQCYCPDSDYSSDELYQKQRDKVTKDLGKLKLFETQLQTYLQQLKIVEWIFVIPSYRKKDLVRHCLEKTEEVKSWGLSIIDPNFRVIIHDVDNFIFEIGIALQGTEGKVIMQGDREDIEPEKIIQWREKSNDFVDNALRKHAKRFGDDTEQLEKKVNTLTDITITDFLNGESILVLWKRMYPDTYDNFLTLTGQIENEVKEMCMFPQEDNNALYKEIRLKVFERIKTAFPFLNEITITDLTNRTIAYWLIRCPLDFE